MMQAIILVAMIGWGASVFAQTPPPMVPPPSMVGGSPPNAVTPTVPTPTPAATPTAEAAPAIEHLSAYQSIMYSKEDLELLSVVIDAVKNKKELPGQKPAAQPAPTIDLTTDFTPEPVSKYYRFPQFHLTSIAFFKPDDWVIWVNGTKITSRKPDIIKRLEIKEVTANQVVFEYLFLSDDKSDFSLESEDERITINQATRTVSFMLQPNQTFSSYNWKIYEGKITQVKVLKEESSNSFATSLPSVKDIFPTGMSVPDAPLSAPSNNINLPPQSMPKQNTGLVGLMNRGNEINRTLPQSTPVMQSQPVKP
jgi:hypothetical protein